MYGLKRMPNPTVMFTIGTLAHAANVNIETIRFYQRSHLMALTVRPPGVDLFSVSKVPVWIRALA